MSKKTLRLDEIGYWSEVKLEIVKKYASAYSQILARQPAIKAHIYIDAFAGAGTHISKSTGEAVAGSPLNAIGIQPPFSELHLIDTDGTRTAELARLSRGDSRVHVHKGDCNKVLLRDVFPRCQFADYRRALCLLIQRSYPMTVQGPLRPTWMRWCLRTTRRTGCHLRRRRTRRRCPMTRLHRSCGSYS